MRVYFMLSAAYPLASRVCPTQTGPEGERLLRAALHALDAEVLDA